jgi:hypothetical protein
MKHFRYLDRTVSLLMIFQERDHQAACGKATTVDRMEEFRL